MSNGGLISGAFSEQSAHTGGIDLSTKGDMHGYSDTNARIPISTNNFSLLCASAESLGLKWASSPTSVLSGAQDILYSSAANTLARLGAGTDGDLLTTHGTGSAPTWETPSGGGIWTAVGNDVQTSAVSELSVSGFTGRDITEVIADFHADTDADTKATMTVNGIATSTYVWSKMINSTYYSGSDANSWLLSHQNNPDLTYFLHMWIGSPNSNFEFTGVPMLYQLNVTDITGSGLNINGIGIQEGTADITEIVLGFTAGDVTGSMQVNNMDYQ